MISTLHNVSVVHHNNEICIPYGRQPVNDDNAGTVLHDQLHRILNCFLRAGNRTPSPPQFRSAVPEALPQHNRHGANDGQHAGKQGRQ